MHNRPFHSLTLASLALGALAAAVPAAAHTTYGSGGTQRSFGSFTGLTPTSVSLANQTVAGAFGWADGTDADFGDAHHIRAFRFQLTGSASVSISVTAATNGGAVLGDLRPGFSLYAGLLHITPAKADYDTAEVTLAYLDSLGGVPKEGAFNALGDIGIGNDDGDLSLLSWVGYAVDGTSANFGPADIGGDGLADGFVTGSFLLGAGDYTILIGGADYAATGTTNRGFSATLAVAPIPEPSTYAALAGVAGFALALWRRRARHAAGR